MANPKLLLILIAISWCGLRAYGAPQHHHHRKHGGHARKRSSGHELLRVELRDVLDKAVCPIRQEIDEDVMRVPRRIKMLKCAGKPSPVCQREDVRSLQACCGQAHDTFNTQCVEVTDNVLVAYRQEDGSLGSPQTVSVSVGCTCMIRAAKQGSGDA